MSQSTEKNKALVLAAFDTLFNKRDYAAAEHFWSPNYIQHSAHIEPGREGLFNLVKTSPASLKYEPGVIVADGDFVVVHGRFSGTGLPRNWIAADVVRASRGLLSARSVYPPSGCRYGRAHAQRTHNVLSLQGRLRVLATLHYGWR